MNWKQITPLAFLGLGALFMWWLLKRGQIAVAAANAARQEELDAILPEPDRRPGAQIR